MGSRLSILAGLLAGLIVAGALLAAFVFVEPGPARPSASPASSDGPGASSTPTAPTPSVTPSSPATSPGASVSAAAPGPGATGSGAPGSGVTGSPSASGVTENFAIGRPAPGLDADGTAQRAWSADGLPVHSWIGVVVTP